MNAVVVWWCVRVFWLCVCVCLCCSQKQLLPTCLAVVFLEKANGGSDDKTATSNVIIP